MFPAYQASWLPTSVDSVLQPVCVLSDFFKKNYGLWCLLLIGSLESPRRLIPGCILRKRVNWEREIHAELGCHQLVVWDPGLNKNKKGEHQMCTSSQMCTSILLCFLMHTDMSQGPLLWWWATPDTMLFLTWWTLSSQTMSLKTSSFQRRKSPFVRSLATENT